MRKEDQIKEVILKTLDELCQTIEESRKATYTKEELLELLRQVATVMTK